MAGHAAEQATRMGYSSVRRFVYDTPYGKPPPGSSWYQEATKMVRTFRDDSTDVTTGKPPEVVVLAGEDSGACLELAKAFSRARWLPTSAVILQPCGADPEARDLLK